MTTYEGPRTVESRAADRSRSALRSIAWRGNTSPCERLLPDDLLFEIFSLCIPGSTYFEDALPAPQYRHQNRWKLDNAPWFLGRICGRWRAVLLSSPALWTTVEISEQYGHPPSLDMLDAYLERSQAAPLAVHWGWYRSPEGQLDNTTDVMFSRLVRKSCHRWREFSCIDPTRLWYDSTEFVPTFPILKYLGLPLKGSRWDEDTIPIGLANPRDFSLSLEPLPALTWLRIIPRPDCHASLLDIPSRIPLEQITTFDTSLAGSEYFTVDDAVTLLRWMPNLIECKFTPCIRYYDPEEPRPDHTHCVPTNLPRLQLLDLCYTKAPEMTELLSQFTFPNLTSLRVLFTEMDPVMAFIRRHSLSLTSLSIIWFLTYVPYRETPTHHLISGFLEEQSSLGQISIMFKEESCGQGSNLTDNEYVYDILELFVRTPSRAVCPHLKVLSTTWRRLWLPKDPWFSRKMNEMVLRIAESRDFPSLSSSCGLSFSPFEHLKILFDISDSSERSKYTFAHECLCDLRKTMLSKDCAQEFFRRRRELKHVSIDVELSVHSWAHLEGRSESWDHAVIG